jgi:hypothetical protein
MDSYPTRSRAAYPPPRLNFLFFAFFECWPKQLAKMDSTSINGVSDRPAGPKTGVPHRPVVPKTGVPHRPVATQTGVPHRPLVVVDLGTLLGSSWEPLGVVLGLSWAVLGPSWAVLGAAVGVLEASCVRLGCVLGRLGGVLARLGCVLARLGSVLWRLGGVLGASWGRLGASWGRPGASWCLLGTFLDRKEIHPVLDTIFLSMFARFSSQPRPPKTKKTLIFHWFLKLFEKTASGSYHRILIENFYEKSTKNRPNIDQKSLL